MLNLGNHYENYMNIYFLLDSKIVENIIAHILFVIIDDKRYRDSNLRHYYLR